MCHSWATLTQLGCSQVSSVGTIWKTFDSADCTASDNNNNSISNNNSHIQGRHLRFFAISSLCREPSPNTYAQVAREQSCANQVQHIERFSRATCVTCHMVRKDSSAIKFDRV